MGKSFLVLLFGGFICLASCSKKEMPAVDNGGQGDPDKRPPAGVTSYLTGDSSDVTRTTTPGLVLMGGGTDVDAAIKWLLTRSGGGDVVVLRASGSDGYNQYMFNMVPVNSVETLLIDSRDKAGLASVARKIRNAEAVFIAGGDQWNYVNYWKDTEVEAAINYLLNTKKVPVGGTSAGCAILGAAYFSAQKGTVTSAETLANPYNQYVLLGREDFLSAPFMQNTITDTHYSQRDRHGRHIGFMARMMKDWAYTNARGIGVDEATAVCIDENGIGKVYGTNQAYFMQNNAEGAETCTINIPLNWNRNKLAVSVYKITGTTTGSGTLNLSTWQSFTGGTGHFYYVNNGVLLQN
jgi:cyanophycinase